MASPSRGECLPQPPARERLCMWLVRSAHSPGTRFCLPPPARRSLASPAGSSVRGFLPGGAHGSPYHRDPYRGRRGRLSRGRIGFPTSAWWARIPPPPCPPNSAMPMASAARRLLYVVSRRTSSGHLMHALRSSALASHHTTTRVHPLHIPRQHTVHTIIVATCIHTCAAPRYPTHP